MNSLLAIKYSILLIILLVSLASGFATFHLASRYQRGLRLSDALANGIFIGAALFHLFPNAVAGFASNSKHAPYVLSLLIMLMTYLLLLFLEKFVTSLNQNKHYWMGAYLLLFTLSLHALIEGITLGLTPNYALLLIVFIAIIAHKSFEMFALVINLYKRLPTQGFIRTVFILFSFVTPLGILVGLSGEHYLSVSTEHWLIAYFNAIASGTFLYVGSGHTESHLHAPLLDGYGEYIQMIAAIAGMTLMGVLSIWI